MTRRISSSGRFQFALPRGERQSLMVSQLFGGLFQFALPRGERRALCSFWRAPQCFNSRSRVGSDLRLP